MSRKSLGSGNSSQRVYFVEARQVSSDPVLVMHGVPLTHEWQRLHTKLLAPGTMVGIGDVVVPIERFDTEAASHGFVSSELAYALAVRFQVNGRILGGLCVETRLVEVEFVSSYTATEIGVCEAFSLYEQLRYLKSAPRDGDSEQGAAPRGAGHANGTET